MRTHLVLVAAVVGFASTVAFSGPSDHASRRAGDSSRIESPEVRKAGDNDAPHALTGGRVQRRVLEYRDVPKGRGQTERVPFFRWVTE